MRKTPVPLEARQEIGELIRRERRRQRLTQAELGAKLDPPASVFKICRLENGKSTTLDLLFGVGGVLKISPTKLTAPFVGRAVHAGTEAAS